MTALTALFTFARVVINPNYSTDDEDILTRAAHFRTDIGGLALVAGVPMLALAIPFLG